MIIETAIIGHRSHMHIRVSVQVHATEVLNNLGHLSSDDQP